jgi:hypothetical protein
MPMRMKWLDEGTTGGGLTASFTLAMAHAALKHPTYRKWKGYWQRSVA